MLYRPVRDSLCGVFLVTCLSACGSEGDTSSSPPPTPAQISAEGLWVGTTGTGRTVSGVVLDDATYWFLYSVAGDPSIIEGFIQGDSSFQNGTLTSSNAKDFSVGRSGAPVLDATMNGKYEAKQSLSGTTVYQIGGPDTFTTTYDRDYELPSDVAVVAGNYSGPVAAGETVNVAVTVAGAISGISTTGCTFTGSFSTRASGNVFDVMMTFGGQTACSNGSDTVRGVGFYDADSRKLYSAAFNTARTNGFIFIGTKP
ncbi:MAG: hypothetical protein IPM58_05385 [Nitrospira sp.]|nr:hypothetical protein [Nitrospira sp.]